MPETRSNTPMPSTPVKDCSGWDIRMRCGNCRRFAAQSCADLANTLRRQHSAMADRLPHAMSGMRSSTGAGRSAARRGYGGQPTSDTGGETGLGSARSSFRRISEEVCFVFDMLLWERQNDHIGFLASNWHGCHSLYRCCFLVPISQQAATSNDLRRCRQTGVVAIGISLPEPVGCPFCRSLGDCCWSVDNLRSGTDRPYGDTLNSLASMRCCCWRK
jgi:hypothetical protein